MKAPDKIYIGHDVYNNVDEYWEENSNSDIPGKSYVEYIRKDALLEWLKEKVEWYKGEELEIAYLRVIDKINKM